jgi:hypothetical protein
MVQGLFLDSAIQDFNHRAQSIDEMKLAQDRVSLLRTQSAPGCALKPLSPLGTKELLPREL